MRTWWVRLPALLTLLLTLLVTPASAQSSASPPLEHTPLSPAQEARAVQLGNTLRCPVCRGVPITESPNELSAQMLQSVREQVASGRTDAQIYEFFAARFGENVLLDPPKQGLNLALWVLPALALAFGALALMRYLRAASRPDETADQELLSRVQRDVEAGR